MGKMRSKNLLHFLSMICLSNEGQPIAHAQAFVAQNIWSYKREGNMKRFCWNNDLADEMRLSVQVCRLCQRLMRCLSRCISLHANRVHLYYGVILAVYGAGLDPISIPCWMFPLHAALISFTPFDDWTLLVTGRWQGKGCRLHEKLRRIA